MSYQKLCSCTGKTLHGKQQESRTRQTLCNTIAAARKGKQSAAICEASKSRVALMLSRLSILDFLLLLPTTGDSELDGTQQPSAVMQAPCHGHLGKHTASSEPVTPSKRRSSLSAVNYSALNKRSICANVPPHTLTFSTGTPLTVPASKSFRAENKMTAPQETKSPSLTDPTRTI